VSPAQLSGPLGHNLFHFQLRANVPQQPTAEKDHLLSSEAHRFTEIAIHAAKEEQRNYINLPVVHDLKELNSPLE
jgi:hypothetical protein